MKILDRYIIKSFLQPFLYCLAVFVFLYLIIDLLNNLEDIINSNTPLNTVILYYLKFTPLILTQTMPMAVLLATLYSLGTLNKFNEIIAIISSGINIWRISSLFLSLGLVLSLLMIYLNNKVVPYAYAESIRIKDQYFQKNKAAAENKIMNNVSLYGMDNRIYFIRSYDPQREEMADVTILEHDNANNLTKKIIAQRGVWIDNRWTLSNLTENNYQNNQLLLPAISATEKSYAFSEKPSDFQRSEIQPMFMTYKQHRRYILWLYRTGRTPVKELIDLYAKVAICFVNLIAVFIALPFSLLQRQRSGMMLGVGISILIAFGYWGLNAIALAFGKAGFLPPFLSAWCANLLLAGLGLFLLKKTAF